MIHSADIGTYLADHKAVWVVLVIIAAIAVVRLRFFDMIWTRYFARSDSLVLAPADAANSVGLQTMAAGKLDDDYVYFLSTNEAGKVMMSITIDHHTAMHIVAIGSKSGVGSRLEYPASRKWLEPVSLEGNFPDDFRMYCSKGKQMEVRQVFGPETMVQFADLCRAYNFELFDNKMYISVAENAEDPADSTTMVTDITNFVSHNRPVFDHLQPTADSPA